MMALSSHYDSMGMIYLGETGSNFAAFLEIRLEVLEDVKSQEKEESKKFLWFKTTQEKIDKKARDIAELEKKKIGEERMKKLPEELEVVRAFVCFANAFDRDEALHE